ncbi:uncharacterized protein LOC117169209 [Belonocnema kinseyi]|uniref:uncharacterized protein LOC117169209 n=1 Tax=Belonocnema kinseyi TaxID=2817044 RepID=UPI00143CC0B2|nr:uncharacterized protein LOC117169209 [Belonocnema kinseyi]
MLAAAANARCHELHFTVLPPAVNNRISRCLFGSPNPTDTANLLKDALEVERTRFQSRWGVNPTSENDKENMLTRYEKVERSPRKRSFPYFRQSNMHEYWRPRKAHEMHKKSNNILEATHYNQQNPDKKPQPIN